MFKLFRYLNQFIERTQRDYIVELKFMRSLWLSPQPGTNISWRICIRLQRGWQIPKNIKPGNLPDLCLMGSNFSIKFQPFKQMFFNAFLPRNYPHCRYKQPARQLLWHNSLNYNKLNVKCLQIV